MTVDIENLREWVGRTEEQSDTVTNAPIAGLAATLDRPELSPSKQKKIPLAAHWLYFLPKYLQSEIGNDGHKIRGEFLPPVDLPRRMWAGGRLEFEKPLSLGDQIRKTSTIKQVKYLTGKTGGLVFVLVGHEITNQVGVTIREDHNIVYREALDNSQKSSNPKPVPGKAEWSRIIEPDPVLLFRYSALTFNSHRIHYDRKYVMEVEGYPGLIVHGPLLATLLLDFFDRQMPSSEVKIFDYRAVSPVFDTGPFSLNGMQTGSDSAKLWVANNDGNLAMSADVKFAN